MHCVLFHFLSVVLTLINCHRIRAKDAAPVCADMQRPMIEHANIGREVLRLEEPHVPFTGHDSLTAKELIRFVQKDYADPLPLNPFIRQIMSNVTGAMDSWGKSKPLSWYFRVDVRVPWMTTCKPIIQGTKRLAQGIVCGGGGGCSFAIKFAVSETYQTTEGLRIETTVSAGASGKGFEASVSSTREPSWEQSWSRSKGSEVEYTFDLGPNQRCIPSMAHVELECDVDFDTAHYDSYFRRPKDLTDLEYSYSRKGGLFNSGQWCFKQRVTAEPLNRNNDCHEVLPNDGHDGNRGDIWRRPGTEMNQYRTCSGGTFTAQDVIIRRARRSGGDGNEIFECRRNQRLRRRKKASYH